MENNTANYEIYTQQWLWQIIVVNFPVVFMLCKNVPVVFMLCINYSTRQVLCRDLSAYYIGDNTMYSEYISFLSLISCFTP